MLTGSLLEAMVKTSVNHPAPAPFAHYRFCPEGEKQRDRDTFKDIDGEIERECLTL